MIRYPEFHFRWEWHLQATPEALWPFVSDTNRFNRDIGLSPVQPLKNPGEPLPNGRQRVKLVHLGVPLEYEEEPFEWIRPYRFGVVRRYSKGPVSLFRNLTTLSRASASGTRLVYEIWARPRNPFGMFAIPVQLRVLSARALHETFRRYDQLALASQSPITARSKVHLTPGGRRRLAALREDLATVEPSPGLAARLAAFVAEADDLAVTHIRPYALADAWGAGRRDVLVLCLHATRAGLLDMQWDLLCPLCRGPKDSPASLGTLQSTVHCDSCNIDFSANFEQSVELTFRINPSVRRVDIGDFCVGSPQITPHIVVQQMIPAGGTRVVEPALEPGRYRLRAYGHPGGQRLLVSPDGAPEATLRFTPAAWGDGELPLAPIPQLSLQNDTRAEQLLMLERLAWTDQSTTAAEVTALQIFRDLFSGEVLRPTERISVGTLTILFTDLRGSTQFYREVGDAVAFGHVLDHFEVLREAIAREDGALIKTIGDSVMAVFRRPVAAVRAVTEARSALARDSDQRPPLQLKAGLHTGPCIAVTLNDRLDYFGSTVNIAARLESLSSGGDIIISSTVYGDPEVAALLADSASDVEAEPFQADLKGFGEESFQLWRIRPALPTT
jgi:class 3 adenylate cyclase